MKYKKGQCVKILRDDSVIKIKKWKIGDIRKIKNIDGRVYDEYILRNKRTKIPIQVEKRWLDTNTSKC